MPRVGLPSEPASRAQLFQGGQLRMIALLGVTTLLLTLQAVFIRETAIVTDVGTLAVVYLALESTLLGGAVASLFVGYIADIFSGEVRGLVSLSLVVLFVVLRLSVVRLSGSRFIPITGLSVLAVLGAAFLRIGIDSFFGPGLSTTATLLPVLPGLLIGAGIFGYPCYRILRFVDDRFGTREEAAPLSSVAPRR